MDEKESTTFWRKVKVTMPIDMKESNNGEVLPKFRSRKCDINLRTR